MVIGWWGDLGPTAGDVGELWRRATVFAGLAGGGLIVEDEVWLSSEGDVHLRIWLGAMVFDYTATAEAARNLIRDWKRKRCCTIEVMRENIAEYPLPVRLPCERLYVGP